MRATLGVRIGNGLSAAFAISADSFPVGSRRGRVALEKAVERGASQAPFSELLAGGL